MIVPSRVHPPWPFPGLLFLALLILHPVRLHAGSPALSIITPRGGQRGAEMEAVFHGERLEAAQEILFYEPGITVMSMNTSNTAALKVRLKLEPSARLGQHVVRVRTASGITEARTLSIGQYPVVEEKEPNNDITVPQRIPLNTTVHGVAGNEDIDYYLVEARKGQRLSAEVEAMRLGSALVDCAVAILDLKRFELAACDDSALALQDPIASVIVPEDGSYLIAVRESSYAGNDSSRYCLHVGDFPRPLMAYPAGGKAGTELELKLLGDVRGERPERVVLPAGRAAIFDYFPAQDGISAPSPNRLRSVTFDNVLEMETNNTPSQATATVADLPLAFNGVVDRPGDVDFFRFKVRNGQRYEVRCFARGIRSPLDPVLAIHKADGGQLAENDDAGGPDSHLAWTVPGDGEYLVSVRDHLGNGGRDYVYRVEFSLPETGLSLSIPEFARNSQERNTVPVPRGNRFATLIRVNRANFSGDVSLAASNLPPEVTMACDLIAGSVNEVPVVFEAATNAPLSARLVPLAGQSLQNKEIVGGFSQGLELIYGEPNNTIYYKTTVNRMAVSVAEEAPFRITVTEPGVPLVQNGSMSLKVVATRREGFKSPITLSMLWNPPGVGSQNEVVLAEGQTEAYYPINAGDAAAVRTWRLALLARGDAGKGTVWTSSQLFPLTVATPYLSLQIPMAAGEQGTNAGILCKIQHLQPFDGQATVHLHGLPPKVTLAKNPLTLTTNQTELIFDATMAADAPVGQHKSLFCQVIVLKNGEPIAHNLGGGGVLRIDAPPPPKPKPATAAPPPAAVEVAQAKPAPAAAPPPPPRPLSRLEKLRLDARERAGARSK